MVDVSQLVSQMHETLSSIHSTISSLSVLDHESRLDDLEKRRAAAVAALQSGFSLESDDLARKRQAQHNALIEQRRREDEEREARRRQEDEALLAQVADEDLSRQGKLNEDTREVEESTEAMMGSVEEEAKRMLDEGKAKLAALEERRRELNRLIDEQLQLPLPSAPSRRKPREQTVPKMVAASNPVDIFDKRNDHADGDRDALSVVTTTTTTETITAEQETDISSTRDAEPVHSTSGQAENISENDSPFHDNQKYLQEVTSHIVPGGFPVSALQSPTSESMTTSTIEEIAEPPQQNLAEVISSPQRTDELALDLAPVESHEELPEQQPEHENQPEELPIGNDESQHHGVEPIDSVDLLEETEHEKSTPSVELETIQPQAVLLEEEHSLEKPCLEAKDQHQEKENNDYEHGEEVLTTTNEVRTDNTQHEEPLHEEEHEEPNSPVADASIPSITIHTTEMTDEYLRETSPEKDVLHDESTEEESHNPIAELTQDHEDENDMHEDLVSTDAVRQKLHLSEEELVHEFDIEAPVVHAEEDIRSHTPETVEEVSSKDAQPIQLEERIPEDDLHEGGVHEPLYEGSHGDPHEELHETLHEETLHDEHLHEENIRITESVGAEVLEEDHETPEDEQEHEVPEILNFHQEHVPEEVPSPGQFETSEEVEPSSPRPSLEEGEPHERLLGETHIPEDVTPLPHASPSMDLEENEIVDAQQHDDESTDVTVEALHEQVGPSVLNTAEEEVHNDQSHDIRQDHEVINHDSEHHYELEPTTEFHQHEDTHDDSIDSHDSMAHQDAFSEHNDVPAWHYQEPYVAQEAYTYPYAAAHEYVDYGSSYYASAQQSLDPSPVFHEVHEAFDEPILNEDMIFVGGGGTEHNVQSLDKELEGESEEEDEANMEAETESSINTFHELHQEMAPEAENAATMHGQDDLFDDDSEESVGSVNSADSAGSVEHEHDHEIEEHFGEAPDKTFSHDTNIPQTPTTIVGDSHHAMEEGTHFDEEPGVEEFGTAAVLSDETYVPEASHHEQIATVEVEEEHSAEDRPFTPDASTPIASQFKGLANSRHAPQQTPVTPPRQTVTHGPLRGNYDKDSLDEDADFMPRDVTHVPWQERSSSIDATPGSVRSQATLSTAPSSFSSPSPWSAAVVAATTLTRGDSNNNTLSRDDPFIRTSWSSTPDGGDGYGEDEDDGLLLGRGKPIGQLDYDGHVVPIVGNEEKKGLALETVQHVQPPSNSRPSSIVAPSPSSLFQRMRSIFEPPNGTSPGTGSVMPAKSVMTASPAVSALRDPYPATSNTTNRLVDEGFIRGVKTAGGHSRGEYNNDNGSDDEDDEDENDHINERSSLLQAAVVSTPLH